MTTIQAENDDRRHTHYIPLRFEIGATLAFDLAEDGHLAVRSPRQVLEANFGTWSLPEGMTVHDAIRIAREEMQEEAVERYLRAMEW